MHTLPRQRLSTRQNQECSLSEATGNQPNNEESTIDNTSIKQRTHVRRRHGRLFGSRKRSYKKKVIKINVEKENAVDEKEDEKEDVEQNGTVLTDGSILDDTLDTSVNSHDPQHNLNIHDKEVEDEEKRSEEPNDSPSESSQNGDKEDTVQNGDLHEPECEPKENCSYAGEERKSTKSLPNGLTATIAIRDIGEGTAKDLIQLKTKGTYSKCTNQQKPRQ